MKAKCFATFQGFQKFGREFETSVIFKPLLLFDNFKELRLQNKTLAIAR